ncbi:MAG: hypothetical protein JW940_14250 [Polyangiaceae bacterium]|nr:hypothetical protein [Polyangiaceae bacterium]
MRDVDPPRAAVSTTAVPAMAPAATPVVRALIPFAAVACLLLEQSCSQQKAPAASPPPAPPAAEEETAYKTVIEQTPQRPFQPGYLDAAPPIRAEYASGHTDTAVVFPFRFGYREAAFHLIAYFHGHPELEAVECMPLPGATRGAKARLMAITTRHDNTQEYYFSVPAPEDRYLNVPVHYADLVCSVDRKWKTAELELPLATSERLVYHYIGYGPPNPQWSMIVDPGGHNPKGGLVVMRVNASNIATTGSALTVGNQGYHLVPSDKSAPPYFIGYVSYLTRGFQFAFINAHARLPFEATSPPCRDPACGKAWSLSGLRGQAVRSPDGVIELASVLASARQSIDPAAHSARLAFKPPFPNLLAMRPGTSAMLRFAVFFAGRPEPACYGDIAVRRGADRAEVDLLPAYPGWAAAARRMRCEVLLAGQRQGSECNALDPA